MFGPDVVLTFCQRNNIKLILRAHQVQAEGYFIYANGHLATVFSARNYTGKDLNKGAMMLVTRDGAIVAKVLHARPLSDLGLKEEWR